jgi:aspartate/methionine/tyrosine aminotransferase
MSLSERGALAPRALIDELEGVYGHLPGVCRMCAGSVGYGPTPAALWELSKLATEIGSGYGPVAGEPALLSALKEKLFLHNGLNVESERCSVIVTAGANQAFLNVLLATADVGDAVVLFSPYYFSHYSACVLAGLQTVVLDVAEDGDVAGALQRYAEQTDIRCRIRAVVVCTPCNPTGHVLESAALWKIANICKSHDWWLIMDEAYEHFDFGMQLRWQESQWDLDFTDGSSSLAGIFGSSDRPYLMHGRTVHIFSMSKSFGMAGYRVGYILCPRTAPTHRGQDLFEVLLKVNDTVATHASRQSQLLALQVLRDVGCVTILQARRLRVLLHVRELWRFAYRLARDGVVQLSPDLLHATKCVNKREIRVGAFYVFLRVILDADGPTHHRDARDLELCRFLAERCRVLVAPGSIFGMKAEECWLRISVGACCANDITSLRVALHRLGCGIRQYRDQRNSPNPGDNHQQNT